MKKIIYILLAFLTFQVNYAQTGEILTPEEKECQPIINSNYQPNGGIYSGSIDPSYLDSFNPVVFNIYFWAINASDGSTHNEMVEDDFLWAVAKLNIEYNKFNVFFKYRGFDTNSFNSDDHYEGNIITNIYNYAQQNGYVEPNSYNVYLPKTLAGGGGQSVLGNVTYFGVRNGPNFYQSSAKTLIHEMGHSLFLAHTFVNSNNSNCEHVARDVNDPTFNAFTHGDYVLDTAAQPQLNSSNFNVSSCTYIGGDGDCQNPSVAYDISESDVTWLAYYTGSCGNKFTIGQQIRIRETIQGDVAGVYDQAETLIASLYEPYKGEYYNIGPTHSRHTTFFQPGFDYEFVECECDCSQPSDYNDTSFSYTNNVVLDIEKEEEDYSIINHPNHTAIRIVHDDPIFIPQPRKCYNNWNRAPSGGTVIKFEDDVFNTNVTITAQDSTSINNQNLINNLPQGLYKIEKSYDDGSTQETIIYKENN